MPVHGKMDYAEFPAKDLSATRAFFQLAFGWSFTEYGPAYVAFSDKGLDGGFFEADVASRVENGGALIVFYSEELEATQAKVEGAGGEIIRPIYAFPGGKRFHFLEPSGNEFAVWGEADA